AYCEDPTMVTLRNIDLCNVVGGGRNSIGPIPGTTIYKVPPKEVVCNREQFDWMAARVGKGVQPHVVAADAALCGFPMPGSGSSPAPTTSAPNTQSFLDSLKFDELSTLAGR